MDTKAGKKDLRVEIDATLFQQLEVAAAGKSKREVVEAALVNYLSGTAGETLLSHLHAKLDSLTVAVARLEAHGGSPAGEPDVTTTVKALEQRLAELATLIESQVVGPLGRLRDAVMARSNGQGWFSGWRRAPRHTLAREAARLAAMREEGVRQVTRLIAEDREAHCGVRPGCTYCRYHVLQAVIDLVHRRAATRRPFPDGGG